MRLEWMEVKMVIILSNTIKGVAYTYAPDVYGWELITEILN